jgi:hypothetical protein
MHISQAAGMLPRARHDHSCRAQLMAVLCGWLHQQDGGRWHSSIVPPVLTLYVQ